MKPLGSAELWFMYFFYKYLLAFHLSESTILGTEDKKMNDRSPAYHVFWVGKTRLIYANMTTEGKIFTKKI